MYKSKALKVGTEDPAVVLILFRARHNAASFYGIMQVIKCKLFIKIKTFYTTKSAQFTIFETNHQKYYWLNWLN